MVDKLFEDRPRLTGTSGSGSGQDEEDEEDYADDEDEDDDDDDDEGKDGDDSGDDGGNEVGGDPGTTSGDRSSSGAQERQGKKTHDTEGQDPKGGSSAKGESIADQIKRMQDYIKHGSVPLEIAEPLRNLFHIDDQGNPLKFAQIEVGVSKINHNRHNRTITEITEPILTDNQHNQWLWL